MLKSPYLSDVSGPSSLMSSPPFTVTRTFMLFAFCEDVMSQGTTVKVARAGFGSPVATVVHSVDLAAIHPPTLTTPARLYAP